MEIFYFPQTAEELAAFAAKLKQQEPFRLSMGESHFVLLPEENYQNFLVTLELLATPGLVKGLDSAIKP